MISSESSTKQQIHSLGNPSPFGKHQSLCRFFEPLKPRLQGSEFQSSRRFGLFGSPFSMNGINRTETRSLMSEHPRFVESFFRPSQETVTITKENRLTRHGQLNAPVKHVEELNEQASTSYNRNERPSAKISEPVSATQAQDPKKNPLPVPIENVAVQSFLRMREIRTFANTMPGLVGAIWIEIK
ncbi:hypothetical protein BIW11_13409, partial [Tropilaelaps mercedesae]